MTELLINLSPYFLQHLYWKEQLCLRLEKKKFLLFPHQKLQMGGKLFVRGGRARFF